MGLKQFKNKPRLAIIGLGYVGLPLVYAFRKHLDVCGYDTNVDKVEKLKSNNKTLTDNKLANDIFFSADADKLKYYNVFIIAVPTPVDNYNKPDLTALLSACEVVGQSLKKEDVVIFESTVYPGCTENDCLPVLEKQSGLRVDVDFYLGYSPERINPGDKIHTLENTVKVVAGHNQQALNMIAELYKLIIKADLHLAPNIKVAEASKIIENTQRDVNIALMNELSIIFNKININTKDVLDAAATKWNFLKFTPGLVGGHCIGVDPYYLSHVAAGMGYHPHVINSGRFVNDSMARYLAKLIVKKIIALGINNSQNRALLLGVTFKENVADIRNSKIFDTIDELKSYGITVDAHDPIADRAEVKKMYGIELLDKLPIPNAQYDVIILGQPHAIFNNLTDDVCLSYTHSNPVIVDIKSLRQGLKNLPGYISL